MGETAYVQRDNWTVVYCDDKGTLGRDNIRAERDVNDAYAKRKFSECKAKGWNCALVDGNGSVVDENKQEAYRSDFMKMMKLISR